MRITEIETIALADPKTSHENAVVRVHTDEGITGMGQAQVPSLVIQAIIKARGGLEDIVRGDDPSHVERLWQKMYARTALWGRRGATIMVMGAVDTALWDITGKALDKPVCELIWRSCGTSREEAEVKPRVVPYGTIYPPAEVEALKRGFRAVKVESAPGGLARVSVKRDVEVVRAARESIGEDRVMMLDAETWYGGDVAWALATLRAVEPYNVFFLEAPFPSDNLEAYARLADAVDTRIGMGDWGCTTRFEFLDIMERGRVDVVQPSSVEAGGISEIMKIAEMAYRRGRLCIPHAWLYQVGVAAEIHMAAVLPNMPFIEYGLDMPRSPVISELLTPAPALDKDGFLEVPRRPGLGFELNKDTVERYRVEPR